MDDLSAAFSVLALLAALALVTLRFGAETRYGFGGDALRDSAVGRRPWFSRTTGQR